MDQIPLQLGVEGGGGIKEREDGQRRGGGGGGVGGAIIGGRRLIEGRLLFEEIRYFVNSLTEISFFGLLNFV